MHFVEKTTTLKYSPVDKSVTTAILKDLWYETTDWPQNRFTFLCSCLSLELWDFRKMYSDDYKFLNVDDCTVFWWRFYDDLKWPDDETNLN